MASDRHPTKTARSRRGPTAPPDDRRLAEARASALDRRLAILNEMVHSAGALLDPVMVSRFIMERAAGLVRSHLWRLYRVDEAAGVLRLDAHEPAGAGGAALELPLECGLAGWAARQRETVRVANPAVDPRLDRALEWPLTAPGEVLAAPLISRGRVIGVAEFAAAPGARFADEDLNLVATLMEPAAIALDNALLFRKLEERTVTDDLTRLYNARFMDNCLRRETKRAERFGHPVSLLFLDLDGFKQVNDRHGHLYGSRTLVEVGDLLRLGARDIDVVARWGGDEFVIVLPETGAAGAQVMAERIRRRIGEQHYLRDFGLDIQITVSIGVAAFPDHARTPEALLAAADAAMYQVKYSGKNAVRLAELVAAR